MRSFANHVFLFRGASVLARTKIAFFDIGSASRKVEMPKLTVGMLRTLCYADVQDLDFKCDYSDR